MFPHKQNIAATHSLQVLQGFVQPPLPSLCCHVAPSYFFRGSPGPFLSHPPNSTETSTPQPSTETCAYMCVCVCVRLFLCVHVHKPLCVHISVCVCVCVQWYCTYLSVYLEYRSISSGACSQRTFPGRAWRPLWHGHVSAACVVARFKVMSPSASPGANDCDEAGAKAT